MMNNNHLYKKEEYSQLIELYKNSRENVYSDVILEAYANTGIEFDQIEGISKSLLQTYEAFQKSEIKNDKKFFEDIKRVVNNNFIKYTYEFSGKYWGDEDAPYYKLQRIQNEK